MKKIIPLFAGILLAGTVQSFAQDVPTLTIYTYDGFAADWGPAPQIKAGFEETCGCTLDFVSIESSIGVLRKVQLEGAATKADIVLGLDTNISAEARATGIFAPHGVENVSLDLPYAYEDDVFLPFDYGYFSFVYKKENVATPPTSLAELAALPDDFKIIIHDPRSSTPGLGLLLWVKAVFGDEADEYWEKLAPKIVTVSKSWSEGYGLFLKDEADMVLSYTTSPAYHAIAESDEGFASAPFSDGHYGQIEVAAIVASSDQQELAQDFMSFMITAKFQDVIPETNWVYPVVKTEAGLPKGFPVAAEMGDMLLLDESAVKDMRKEWTQEWLAAIGK